MRPRKLARGKDGRGRSVPGAARPDHQHAARAGAACGSSTGNGSIARSRRFSEQGRPGIESRFVIGLLLLKHIFALSDEEVCDRWVYDPYFQHFTGEEFFQHAFPHERSDLSHWRKRLGDKLELLLAESLRVAHDSGALRTKDLERVTVDTTVQPKAVSGPFVQEKRAQRHGSCGARLKGGSGNCALWLAYRRARPQEPQQALTGCRLQADVFLANLKE